INISNFLNNIKKFFNNEHFNNIVTTISKFQACLNSKKGFVKWECPRCLGFHFFKLTCKSRLCPACGKKYSTTWAENTAASLINVKHRHILFTIPEQCRKFFALDRNNLTKLAYAVNDIMQYQFHNIYAKNKRINKIGIYSDNYFTPSDIIHYGLITVIHTFGRDLKWNPHIHAIVTLGGFNKNNKYIKKNYFHVNAIAGQWKKLVIDIIKNGNYDNHKIKLEANKVASMLYKQDIRFFFSVGHHNDLNNNMGAIKYIGRYLSRAPIAEYRIIDVSDDKVSFWYEDLANNKEKTYLTLDIETFISKLLIHIPPKNFRMIHRFGIYSRNVKKEIKNIMKTMRKYVSKYSKTTFYQLEIWNTFKVNPFYCFGCNIKMRVKMISYENVYTGSKFTKEYVYKN
ncbi:IS91 family transposase, partial [Oceanivirga salmonicida]|uniref:IS91 family transposase n=1 Tax=Oceanivirga salmonicida TaxID=1769291 RepID=UPI0012E17F39